jgi:hypothetical protein
VAVKGGRIDSLIGNYPRAGDAGWPCAASCVVGILVRVSHFAGRIAAPAATVLLAASCAGGPAVNTGPLGNGGTRGGICAYLPPRTPVLTYGIIDLHNAGSSNAVIENVALVHPRHLRLAAAYVVPITGHLDFGVWDGYPPVRHQAGVEWSRHQAAKGARLPPARSKSDHANLVEVLQPTGPVGTAQATDIFYREGGIRYHLRNIYWFKLLVGRECPGAPE